jgi:serine/threonine protein kinase
MSTNADLAAWNEPPADAREEALAALLDSALERLDRGEVPAPERLVLDPVEIVGRVGDLVGSAASLHEAARRLRAEGDGPAVADAVEMPDPLPGKYRLRCKLGAGAFGKVWLADDLHLGRPVALKFLLLPEPGDGRLLALLRHEARLLASVRHPNIVQVHTWEEAGPDHFIVLQYVPGGSLAARVRADGPLPWATAARYVADVAEGLLEVHARGIVHRDVKPANMLWDPERDEALLTDFGVSVRLGDASGVAGTPLYMAPEAFDGRASPALDTYGLAASLFWLVTGSVPFPPGDGDDYLDRIARGLPEPDPRCAGLPEPLERLIRAGLAPAPGRRPPLCDFAAALRGSLNGLLADSLIPAGPGPAARLRLLVSRQVGRDTFVPLAATRGEPGVLRDMKRVPPAPDRLTLRTGDRVRVEVLSDRPGFVTVFNVGPTGNLNLLHPADGGALAPSLPAGHPLHILDVALTPPSGAERLFALWSRVPLPLNSADLLRLAERGEIGSGPYRATRDMTRLRQSVLGLPAEEWQAVVLQLDHRSEENSR